MSSFDAWCTRLRARADMPPVAVRAPLLLSSTPLPIGSVEPALAQRMHDAGLPLRAAGDTWRIIGPADAALAELARWLHAHGQGGRWRDELLPVGDSAGEMRCAIERAAVRPLGITTHAVHLVGRRSGGEVWVQQRALSKATDPGLWDTLVGGLVSAGETIAETLERETWEEAGLRLAELQGLNDFGRITVRRPVSDGYMVEHIHLFEASVPAHAVPVNQDGEVECFEALSRADLQTRLRSEAFTLEASLILAQWQARPHR